VQATALLFAGFETLLSCTAAATAARQCSAASAQAGPLAPHAALVRSTAFRDSFTDEIADARCAPVLQVGSFCFFAFLNRAQSFFAISLWNSFEYMLDESGSAVGSFSVTFLLVSGSTLPIPPNAAPCSGARLFGSLVSDV
jgi:hypothetical protein